MDEVLKVITTLSLTSSAWRTRNIESDGWASGDMNWQLMISLIVQITNIDNIPGVQGLVFGGPQSALQHAYLHAPVDIEDGTDCCRGPVYRQGTSRILTYRWTSWTWSYASVCNNHDGNHVVHWSHSTMNYREPGLARSRLSSHHIVYGYLHLCTQSTYYWGNPKNDRPIQPWKGPSLPQQMPIGRSSSNRKRRLTSQDF